MTEDKPGSATEGGLPRGTPRAVGLVVNPARGGVHELAQIAAWAQDHGLRLVALDSTPRFETKAAWTADTRLDGDTDLIIAMGGDGTILHALSLGAPSGVPVLGVNLGHLGFLAEVEPPGLAAALADIAQGDYAVQQRLALDGRIITDSHENSLWAANDLVVARTAGYGEADVAVSIGGDTFTRFSGDGVIVSTPTGTTAYTLSAGGPIVSPAASALVVTPLANHGMFNRSLVVDAAERIEVRVLPGSAPVTIEHDGVRHSEVSAGAHLRVSKSDTYGRLVKLGPSTFYHRARTRLQLADPLELGHATDSPPRD